MIKIIYCVDKTNGFSFNQKLPWTNKDEMMHFKKNTINKTVLMGRKTYESIGRLLPNRENIIFSRDKKLKIKNAIVTDDIDWVVEKSIHDDIYVIGGQEIINLFLPFADEIIESILKNDYKTDMKLKINKDYFKIIKSVNKKDFKINYYQTKILSGYKISKKIKYELIAKNNYLIKENNKKPSLVIVNVGDNFASSVYINNKVKLAKEIGIEAKVKKFDDTTTNKLSNYIDKCNKDKTINGILVQLPLPKNIDQNKILNKIDPLKDVDCLNNQNIGNLFNITNESILPCTPNAVIEILKRSNVKIEGKNVVIIGRSNIVGKPLGLLLLNENATVTTCHSRTKNLKNITINADILISAVGKEKLITDKHIKKGAILIDVGINRSKDNKICGDIDFLKVLKKCDLITPVPRGVGPMTVIMMLLNLLNATNLQNKKTTN
ncbi:MAG: dihydrofolate reductase [Mycoplasmoidaceae bacterium]